MNPVTKYCDLYSASGLSPGAFALHALAHHRQLCVDVLDIIGSWSSSDPELAALQRAFR